MWERNNMTLSNTVRHQINVNLIFGETSISHISYIKAISKRQPYQPHCLQLAQHVIKNCSAHVITEK